MHVTLRTTVTDLRGHVLYDAVEKVKTLVVISLGGNKLLENSKQARLSKQTNNFLMGKTKIKHTKNNSHSYL